MTTKTRADQVAGGVFLIGLAVLFMTGFWWPGILFVIGASSMARGVAEGHDWYSVPGGLWMIGLGLVFFFGFSWPMILILIGLSMLFGKNWQDQQKAKRAPDEKRKIAGAAPSGGDTYYIDESEASGEYTIEDLLDREKRKNDRSGR
jgi:predicted phage tail protein